MTAPVAAGAPERAGTSAGAGAAEPYATAGPRRRRGPVGGKRTGAVRGCGAPCAGRRRARPVTCGWGPRQGRHHGFERLVDLVADRPEVRDGPAVRVAHLVRLRARRQQPAAQRRGGVHQRVRAGDHAVRVGVGQRAGVYGLHEAGELLQREGAQPRAVPHGDDLGAVVAGGREDQIGADHVLVHELAPREAARVGAEVREDRLGVGLHRRALVAPRPGALHDEPAARRVAQAAAQGMAGQPLRDR